MSIFDYLKDILYSKKLDPNLDEESLKEFSGFMCQRWLSMYSDDLCNYLNCTTNMLWSIQKSKEDWYKLFMVLIPKMQFKKINYIKKEKKTKKQESNDNVIAYLASSLELSQREIKNYIDNYDIDINSLKKTLKGKKNE